MTDEMKTAPEEIQDDALDQASGAGVSINDMMTTSMSKASHATKTAMGNASKAQKTLDDMSAIRAKHAAFKTSLK